MEVKLVLEKMVKNKEEQLRTITKYFGIETEIMKLNEEIGELANACYMYENGKKLEDIEDECADVLVVLSQLMLFYDCDLKKIQDIYNKKISRTLERIAVNWYEKHR